MPGGPGTDARHPSPAAPPSTDLHHRRRWPPTCPTQQAGIRRALTAAGSSRGGRPGHPRSHTSAIASVAEPRGAPGPLHAWTLRLAGPAGQASGKVNRPDGPLIKECGHKSHPGLSDLPTLSSKLRQTRSVHNPDDIERLPWIP
jgi:hypothetical protein